MSKLDFNILTDLFGDQEIIFFDIGCCDLWDTKDFVELLPNAKIYAFEPLKHYYDIDVERAEILDINFYNYAVSDIDGEVLFYPSTKQGDTEQLQSSSIFKPTNRNVVSYGEPYTVKSVTIESFCDEHNISPDFIHIDVEGAEYNVFSKIGKHRPKGIWLEVIGFRYYENGRSHKSDSDDMDYELHQLLENLGYYRALQTENDALYLLKTNN